MQRFITDALDWDGFKLEDEEEDDKAMSP